MKSLSEYLEALKVSKSETSQSPPTETAADMQVGEKSTQHPGDSEKFGNDPNVMGEEEDEEVEEDKSEAQYGVRAAIASLEIWTLKEMIVAYILIWLIKFALSFTQSESSTLNYFVTSSFGKQSMAGLTTTVSTLVGGLVKLPYAKLIDIWGRPHGYSIMVLSFTVGMIMMAGCNNIATYVVAQIFYMVGYNGIDFAITIFVADTCSLRNRALVLAYMSTPSIATVWATGPAAQKALVTIGWRWAYGMWAIIMPVLCFPLGAMFFYTQIKAERRGLVHQEPSGRNWKESFKHYMIEFDVIGLTLITAGLALFLLAFNLYSYQKNQWRSGMIIAFIVVGAVLIVGFVLYERFLAPRSFIPWNILKNRTVIFTFTMIASLYTPYYIWYDYLQPLLMLVFKLQITPATYVQNTYTVGSAFWSIVMGLMVRYDGRVKWHAVLFGVPMTILGVGLMIHFRTENTDVGYVVMCLIFVAFGGGTLVIAEQMTVMAVAPQKDVAAVLSVEGMISSIGGSVGSTISTAMWTGIQPEKLKKYLPAGAPFAKIYGDQNTQLSYPVGSPTRTAINHAYSDTQRLMLITATCMYSITWVSTMLWQDLNVKKMKKQQKNRII